MGQFIGDCLKDNNIPCRDRFITRNQLQCSVALAGIKGSVDGVAKELIGIDDRDV